MMFIDAYGLDTIPLGHHLICQRLTRHMPDDERRYRLTAEHYNMHDASRYSGITEMRYRVAIAVKIAQWERDNNITQWDTKQGRRFAEHIRRLRFKGDSIIAQYNRGVMKEIKFQKDNPQFSYKDKKSFNRAFKKYCDTHGTKLGALGAFLAIPSAEAAADEFAATASAWMGDPSPENELALTTAIAELGGAMRPLSLPGGDSQIGKIRFDYFY